MLHSINISFAEDNMTTDYSKIEWKVNPGFKGGEGTFYNKMFTDGVNKMMYGKLEPGSSIGYHKHEGSCEMIFILEGEGKVLFDDTEEDVKPGMVHYCPEGHSHSLINNGSEDLVFYAVVPKQ